MCIYLYEKLIYLFIFTRSRRDIRENSKAPTFPHWIRIEIVVLDQGEIWWRQCSRHKNNIDAISFIAKFATQQESRDTTTRYYQNSIPYISEVTTTKRGKWHFCDAPLNFSVLICIWAVCAKQTTNYYVLILRNTWYCCVWRITQLAKLGFNHSIGRTHSLRFSIFLSFYNEAREWSEPFFPWFSKEKKASS